MKHKFKLLTAAVLLTAIACTLFFHQTRPVVANPEEAVITQILYIRNDNGDHVEVSEYDEGHILRLLANCPQQLTLKGSSTYTYTMEDYDLIIKLLEKGSGGTVPKELRLSADGPCYNACYKRYGEGVIMWKINAGKLLTFALLDTLELL